jgi:hypothetical protein
VQTLLPEVGARRTATLNLLSRVRVTIPAMTLIDVLVLLLIVLVILAIVRRV